jgi:hypothetical protein
MTIPRYSLRNKEKLIAAHGEPWHQSIIKDLDSYFDKTENPEIITGTKYEFIKVPYSKSECHSYMFVILSVEEGEYRLAYHSTILDKSKPRYSIQNKARIIQEMSEDFYNELNTTLYNYFERGAIEKLGSSMTDLECIYVHSNTSSRMFCCAIVKELYNNYNLEYLEVIM